MYLNRITLIGFLGSNAEVRTVNNSTFTLLSLATKSSYKDKKNGEYVSHTEWHRAIVWGKLADYAKTVAKGSHIQVEGELRSREYEDKKNGNAKRRVWEIRVDSILKLDRAEKASADDASTVPEPEEVPF
jgi:single-strand DNA-binding protein